MSGIRTILFYTGYSVSLVIYATFCIIVGLFLSAHQRLRLYMQWNAFVMWWLRIICNVRIRIEGMENVPAGAFVLASNHQSPWETLFLTYQFIPACAILKRELLNIPFFGWALRMLSPIAIDRSKPKQARLALLQQGQQRLDDGITVIVFPEGTRVAPGDEKKYSNGAAELAIATGAPLVPLAHNAGHCWPAHKLTKYPGTIRVVIGEPYSPQGRMPRELTEQVQNWTRATLAGLESREQ